MKAPLALRLAASLALIAGSPAALAQSPSAPPLEVLMRTLTAIENPAAQANILRGMNASLKGRRDLPVPASWETLYPRFQHSPSDEVRQQAKILAVTFGGETALAEMRRTLGDGSADPTARRAALDSLIGVQDAPALPLLLNLLKQPGPLRAPALRGLAGYSDGKVPGVVLAVLPQLELGEKNDALNTLLSRPASARALLAAIDAGRIEREVITAPFARQLQNIKDGVIAEWIVKNWGVVRTSSAEKQQQVATFKKFLGTDAILRADAARGRTLFAQVCGACHAMFGEGGKIGPELPGSFDDVDYLLQNIVDPNSTIGKDYQQTFITTKSGQLVAGIITAEDDREVVLKTLADPVRVSRGDIAELKTSDQSMMPEGLLAALDEQSVRDLFLYLRQRQQVPLKPTAP